MKENIPESSAQTGRRIKDLQDPIDDNLPPEVDVLNALALRVEHADGQLTKFDIVKITNALEQSTLAIGRVLDDETQGFINELCSQVVQALTDDMSESEIIEVDDIDLQVEMTLMLNQQAELAKAYIQRHALRC
ncbi:MAG: hypothetical protein JKX81_11645 [Arenicella sp.]|nr:hypothetical protein [Arenicella sp.]